MPKVPGYQEPLVQKRLDYRTVSINDDMFLLKNTVNDLNKQIKELKLQRKEFSNVIKAKYLLEKNGGLNPIILYALELEDNCFYVGMTFNIKKRFSKHVKGKGAQWTKLHPPIKIIETRTTKLYSQDKAALMENDMTFEYVMKYGRDFVRGGGYCQTNPRWPSIILQNEPNYK